jgi:hypothetical protein
VRRSFSLKAKLSENKPIFSPLIFALSETLQESENNESETKILSEKLKSFSMVGRKETDSYMSN